MDNAPYYDQINAYLKGALSPEDRAAFEQALQTDADLAAELDFQRSLKAAAGHRTAQAQAKDIMAHLRSKGIFENAAQQAERDRQLLESAGGDPEAIARLLAEHPSLADWKALDPEGFEEVARRSTPVLVKKQPARVVPVWVWVRRVAALAAVVVLGVVGYLYVTTPRENNKGDEFAQNGNNDSTTTQQSPQAEDQAIALKEPVQKPGEDRATMKNLSLPTLRGDSLDVKDLIARLDAIYNEQKPRLSYGLTEASNQSCCIRNIKLAINYFNDDWPEVLRLTASIASQGADAVLFAEKNSEPCTEDCESKIVQFARVMFTRAYVEVYPEKKDEIRKLKKYLPTN